MNILKNIEETVKMGNEALEKQIKLQTLTGFSIDVLIDLFAKGYTLKCPETISERSIEKMADRYKEGYNDCNRDWEKKIEGAINKLHNKEKELENSISEEEREQYSDAMISYELMDIAIRTSELQDILKKG